jgi:hypothetical protein
LPNDVLGEFCEWNASDVDGLSVGQFNICGLEWGRLHGSWDLHGYRDSGDSGDGYFQQCKPSDDWNWAGQFFDSDDHSREQRGVWIGANRFAGNDWHGAVNMLESSGEHHLQYRAKFNHLDRESDQCGDRGGDVLQRMGAELCADAWSVWEWIRAIAGNIVSVRDGVEIQEAAAVGSFIWVADNFCGGNVGVQQRGEITERIGHASGKLSIGRDCHGAERGSIQRQFNAEGAIAPGGVARLDFGFGVAVLL